MDRIKKIKTKKADGSLSDYIPLGADAENIDMADGSNVETTIERIKNHYAKYYDTVADMKADNELKGGDTAVTLGYYEANDGGGAEYKIVNDNTLVDDGGSIHDLSNNLKAKIVVNNYIYLNVCSFGAKRNKEEDSTAAFQNAINFAKNKNGNIKVIIPEGTFIIGSLIIPGHTTLIGMGWNSTYLKVKGGTTDNLLSIIDKNSYFITMKNFTIVGNKTENTCPNIIYINREEGGADPIEGPSKAGDSWIYLDTIRIIGGYGNGIGTGDKSQARENRFYNLDINNCRGYGIKIGGSDNYYFNITCWGNGLGGFYLKGSNEKMVNCKAFASGVLPNLSYYKSDACGFYLIGGYYQLLGIEAQENNGHGIIFECSNSILIGKSDTNGRSEKGSENLQYGGIYLPSGDNNIVIQRNYINLKTGDFLAGLGKPQSQKYGAIIDNAQYCEIFISADPQITAVKDISKNNIQYNNNTIYVNGTLYNNLTASQMQIYNKTTLSENKGNLKFGKNDQINFNMILKNSDFLQLDLNNGYSWLKSLMTLDKEGALKIMNPKIGFYNKIPIEQQTINTTAITNEDAITLVNNIREILINLGLVK